jgi:hypothetical protein
VTAKKRTELDPRTLRAVADDLADARDTYAEFAKKIPQPTNYFHGKADALRHVVRVLRAKASRAEKRAGR